MYQVAYLHMDVDLLHKLLLSHPTTDEGLHHIAFGDSVWGCAFFYEAFGKSTTQGGLPELVYNFETSFMLVS